MADENFIKERADAFVVEVEAFIATLTFPKPSDRLTSVVVVIDGADDGARAVYEAIRNAAPPEHRGGFGEGPIPTDKICLAICPYVRLKECAAKCGYSLGTQQDKDPPANSVRVASFTEAGVVVATWQLLAPVVGIA
jgi:hypothetical protein